MSFTDEEIKDLKSRMDWGFNCSHDYICACPASRGDEADYFIPKVRALLARLEAAEKAYLAYRNDPEVRHTPEQVELGLAWRKSKGLSDSEEPAGEVK